MKNIFEEIYGKAQELKKAYDTAECETAKENIETEYQKLMNEISGFETSFINIWEAYEESKNKGNEYIDLCDIIWDKDIEDVIVCLKENGIRYFTFSSTWSGAVETAWLFTKNGCLLKGMVEIKGNHRDFKTGEYEKQHAFLFRIN